MYDSCIKALVVEGVKGEGLGWDEWFPAYPCTYVCMLGVVYWFLLKNENLSIKRKKLRIDTHGAEGKGH